MVLYFVKICHLYFNKILIGQQPGRKYRQDDQAGSRCVWGDQNRILGRGKAESAVITQMQRKQDTNASLIKVLSHKDNTDMNYGFKCRNLLIRSLS